MFNTQLYIGPDGTLIGKHQKIMPTVGERLVHMGGYGDTFGAFQTEFGPMSGLICGENSNPLAVFALLESGCKEVYLVKDSVYGIEASDPPTAIEDVKTRRGA